MTFPSTHCRLLPDVYRLARLTRAHVRIHSTSSDYEGVDPTKGASAGLYMWLTTTKGCPNLEKRVRSRPKSLLRREITTFRLP